MRLEDGLRLARAVPRAIKLAESRARLRLASGPASATLFEAFESLGDNCEFGFVQRAYGASTVGLFNFAATTIDQLSRVLETRFDALRTPHGMDLAVHVQGNEYIVVLGAYGITFHAGVRLGEAALETIQRQQARRVALLARKMIEDLETGGKIFVYRSAATAPRDKIDGLASQLRAYGPATLLWITTREPSHSAGEVEWLSEGLLRAYIDRFSPADSASNFSPAYWPTICRRAYRMWRRGR